ncbi:MAG: Rne/Rng family ribonuclease [Elusimicrobiota bacterium]
MTKKIFADINEDEKRVAIMESGRLVDLHIEREDDRKTIGNVYMGVIQNVVGGINSCFVDIGTGKNAFLPISDYKGDIKKGKKVLVQVSKEAVQDKGAKITGKISLPGRYVVFMPTESKIGVSRNINNKKKRKWLRRILSKVTPKKGGFVVRTHAKNKTKKEILREAKFLKNLWKKIKSRKRKSLKNNKPELIFKSFDIVNYAAREFLDKKTQVFMVNNKRGYKKLRKFVKKIFPSFKNKIKYYKSDIPLFERYKIEHQIENIKKRTLQLDCGGYIIIEQTEALTAIDVNTGSYTSGSSREKTAIKVNKEAARLAASQVILRDIGGIIIIDFIDQKKRSNRDSLLGILKHEMRFDKAKSKIFPMTRLGLIEITRQRRKETILNILGKDCPYCKGSGIIFSEMTMYIKIKKEVLKKGPSVNAKVINLFLHPRVAEVFDQKGLGSLEKKINKKIKLRRDYKMHHEEYRISS